MYIYFLLGPSYGRDLRGRVCKGGIREGCAGGSRWESTRKHPARSVNQRVQWRVHQERLRVQGGRISRLEEKPRGELTQAGITLCFWRAWRKKGKRGPRGQVEGWPIVDPVRHWVSSSFWFLKCTPSSPAPTLCIREKGNPTCIIVVVKVRSVVPSGLGFKLLFIFIVYVCVSHSPFCVFLTCLVCSVIASCRPSSLCFSL